MIVRTILAVAGVSLAWIATPTSASAQFGSREGPEERVLFLVPQPADPDDGGYVAALAEEVRERMESKFRNDVVTVGTEQVCRVLQESAYTCNAVLGAADADRLARALRADAYIVGSFWRDESRPMGRFRMVDIGRSGLSGWMTVDGAGGQSARDFARTLVDSLDAQVKAAERARRCSEKRDDGDFRDAIGEADRVFRDYPNHPSAAMCAEVSSEALQQPADSQISYLRRAVAGDSLLTRGWERLGRLYQQKGDSLNALHAFTQQSRAVPGDRQLRIGVIAGAITLGEHESGRELADEWIEANPEDLEVLRLKTRACIEGGLWDCAMEALVQQYAADSGLRDDEIFYQQVLGAAQALGDVNAELEWSGRAVENVPGSLTLWRAHATVLGAAAGDTIFVEESLRLQLGDSTVVVYEHILMMDSTDVRSALAASEFLLEGVVVDTAVPLDTDRMFRGFAFLDHATRVAGVSADTAVLMNAAVKYYQMGSELVQGRVQIPFAIGLLEKAIQNDVLERLSVQSNFFLGLGLMFQIFEFDQQVTATQSCELVDQEADMIARGKAALMIGAELAPAQSQQFLQQFEAFEQRVPQLRRAYNCG
jgi:tetratricopeptide (TPR) repeat protein